MDSKQLLTEAGLDATYWGKKIIRAEKRGYATNLDIRTSRRWTTCACGKQDERIPRYECGIPEDLLLQRLGDLFPSALYSNEWVESAKILIAIERRAAVLLAEFSHPHNLEV